MWPLDDTIAAIASPAGGGLRGVVRLSGPRTVEVLKEVFQVDGPSSHDPWTIRRPSAWEGSVRLAEINRLLPVTLYLWPTSRSYTRQPCAELHTLGSPPLLDGLLATLCSAGARLARPGEFTLRAFLGGRLDLTQAEAVLATIDSRHEAELTAALRQLAGGLSTPIHKLRAGLLDLLADLEAGLDFVEEDISFLSRTELLDRLDRAEAALADLAARMRSRASADGLSRVVLRGWPNVGKSSLFNALLGRDAALVSPEAHTTRDYLCETLQIGDLCVELIDTAGLELQTSDLVHSAAQALSSEQHQRADWTLLCLDRTRPINAWERAQLESLERTTIVWTKCDAVEGSGFRVQGSESRESRDERRDTVIEHRRSIFDNPTLAPQPSTLDPQPSTLNPQPCPAIPTSARTGTGIAGLRRHLADVLTSSPASHEGCVATTAARCRESIHRAAASIARARTAARGGQGDELIAVELRAALDELGTVTGALYTDDLLDRIFSRFCIGK